MRNSLSTSVLSRRKIGGLRSYDSVVMADAPLFWYRFRETSGTTVNDSSGNGRNGTWTNGNPQTYAAAGPILTDGLSKSVNIQGRYVNVPYASYMDTPNHTYEIWLRGTTIISNSGVMGRFNSSGGGLQASLMWFNLNTGQLEFAAKSASGQYRAFGYGTLLTWQHVVGTWDGSLSILYINGDPMVATPGTGVASTGAGDFQIGSYQNATQPLNNHNIAEALLYGTALSAAKVKARYKAALGIAA